MNTEEITKSKAMLGTTVTGLLVTRNMESGGQFHAFWPFHIERPRDGIDSLYPQSAWGMNIEAVEIPTWASVDFMGVIEW